MSTAHDQSVQFAILATDVVVCTIRDGELLIRVTPTRSDSPYEGKLALPGGLIRPTEDAESAIRRILDEKAALSPSSVYLEQLYTFSKVNRDPRGRVVAVAYIGLVPWSELSQSEQAGSESAMWISARKPKGLAYDHDEIVATALTRLASRIQYTTLVSRVMPSTFTLTDLERAYVTVLGAGLDKRNFRKKILKLDIVKPLKGKMAKGQFRPAQLYSFVSKKVEEIEVL